METINPPRTLSRNPLFQVVMHFRNRPQAVDFTADGTTTMTGIAKHYEVSFMDIHFDYTVESNGDLTTRVVVNTDLYEPATGAVFADALAGVVEAFATAPDRSVADLRVVPEDWDTGQVVIRHGVPVAPVAAVGGTGATLLTDTERTIATLLAELLEIDEVGREDGFFALGGDSVIAIQLSARAGRRDCRSRRSCCSNTSPSQIWPRRWTRSSRIHRSRKRSPVPGPSSSIWPRWPLRGSMPMP